MNGNNKIFDQLFCQDEPCCDNPDIVIESKGRVCKGCGADHGRTFVDQGFGLYNTEDINNKKTNESAWRDFGPRTFIGNKDVDTNGMDPRKRSRFYRLAKIQGSLIGSVERNLAEAKPQMKKLTDDLNLPKHIRETAWDIYARVAQKHLTLGRSISTFVVAAVYIAIRVNRFYKLMDQVVEASMVSERSLLAAINLISRSVLPEMGLKYSYNGDVPLIIIVVGNKLNLPLQVISMAVQEYVKKRKAGLKNIGHNPKGIAAAFIYIACRKLQDKRTQIEIAKEAKVTEVTLRARLKEITEL